MTVTFLLPCNSHSGGVRVTMQLGNCLLKRGHNVRIAYRTNPLFSRDWFFSLARSVKFRCQAISETRWLQYFNGKKEPFRNLNNVRFRDGEIVIATGEHTIGDLYELQGNINRLRYCHG